MGPNYYSSIPNYYDSVPDYYNSVPNYYNSVPNYYNLVRTSVMKAADFWGSPLNLFSTFKFMNNLWKPYSTNYLFASSNPNSFIYFSVSSLGGICFFIHLLGISYFLPYYSCFSPSWPLSWCYSSSCLCCYFSKRFYLSASDVASKLPLFFTRSLRFFLS